MCFFPFLFLEYLLLISSMIISVRPISIPSCKFIVSVSNFDFISAFVPCEVANKLRLLLLAILSNSLLSFEVNPSTSNRSLSKKSQYVSCEYLICTDRLFFLVNNSPLIDGFNLTLISSFLPLNMS